MRPKKPQARVDLGKHEYSRIVSEFCAEVGPIFPEPNFQLGVFQLSLNRVLIHVARQVDAVEKGRRRGGAWRSQESELVILNPKIKAGLIDLIELDGNHELARVFANA